MAINEKQMAEQAEAQIFGQRRDHKGRYAADEGVVTEPSAEASRELDDVVRLATDGTGIPGKRA